MQRYFWILICPDIVNTVKRILTMLLVIPLDTALELDHVDHVGPPRFSHDLPLDVLCDVLSVVHFFTTKHKIMR